MGSPILIIVASLLCAEAPIPDAASLLKDLQAHQKKIDEMRENYTFHRTRRVEELDGKGHVKKTILEEREIFFVNGHQISRLVKRDGVPLNDSEEKKEQEKARKATVEISKKPPAYGNGGGVNLIGTMLAVAELSHPRRMMLNARSTLVFDFKGNPKAQAHGLQENGAKKLAGTVWIDEADRQVARLEVEFYENFHLAGGLLASIQKGTVLKLEQSPIAEGLWMFTANEQHLNLRVIAKSTRENVYVRNFDFKRFNVEAAGK